MRFSPRLCWVWHFLAGVSVAAGVRYLLWRWTGSLNEEALFFSCAVAAAETLFFLGTVLFYFDIWREGDTPMQPPPTERAQAGLTTTGGAITVDVFITTYDESTAVVTPSIEDACAVILPENIRMRIWLLDDGDRPDMAALAQDHDIGYLSRRENLGFKAGNLRNGLLHTSGDFVVICDADTRLLPTFLQNTLGYFRDEKVAWVQTPHWFYDIPDGQSWAVWVQKFRLFAKHPEAARRCAKWMSGITGKDRVGGDPFLSDTSVFFDVIQRRRNRNGASFCCGAASIHRREAIFHSAMGRKLRHLSKAQKDSHLCAKTYLPAHPIEPYRFHVSEDLYTSILLHEDPTTNWRSVYHPAVEARMLSPVSLEAWAAQRVKYAGGTFDIALRDNPLFRSGLSWAQKLHYCATFWSYLSLLWAPILLLAPAYSLLTGITPVNAYSIEFFTYFLPAVLMTEWAMIAACKGYAIGAGRALGIAGLPILWRAFICVLRGKTPKFAPTPKLPMGQTGLRFVAPNIGLILIMLICAAIGIWRTAQGQLGFNWPLLWVNLFWLSINIALLAKMLPAAFWRISPSPSSPPQQNDPEVPHVSNPSTAP